MSWHANSQSTIRVEQVNEAHPIISPIGRSHGNDKANPNIKNQTAVLLFPRGGFHRLLPWDGRSTVASMIFFAEFGLLYMNGKVSLRTSWIYHYFASVLNGNRTQVPHVHKSICRNPNQEAALQYQGGGFHRLLHEDGGATVHYIFFCRNWPSLHHWNRLDA